MDFYEDGQLRCYYLLRPAFVTALLEVLGAESPVPAHEREDVRQEGRLQAGEG